jgi:hypothetical protein
MLLAIIRYRRRGNSMNFKTKLIFFIFLNLVKASCWAETENKIEFGIGSGASSAFSKGFGGLFIFPIRPTPHLMIEPFFGYQNRSEDTDRSLPNYYTYSTRSRQIGLGIYGIQRLSFSFELIYGGAFSIGKSSSVESIKNTTTNVSTGINTEYISNSTVDSKEYLIKPSLGISYIVADHYTFSLDMGIYYYRANQDKTRVDLSANPPTNYTVDATETDTFTQAVFRMYFH